MHNKSKETSTVNTNPRKSIQDLIPTVCFNRILSWLKRSIFSVPRCSKRPRPWFSDDICQLIKLKSKAKHQADRSDWSTDRCHFWHLATRHNVDYLYRCWCSGVRPTLCELLMCGLMLMSFWMVYIRSYASLYCTNGFTHALWIQLIFRPCMAIDPDYKSAAGFVSLPQSISGNPFFICNS